MGECGRDRSLGDLRELVAWPPHACDGSYNDDPEYKGETLTLVNSVNRAAASGCKVLLPVAMDCASNNSCVREAGVLDGHDVALRD